MMENIPVGYCQICAKKGGLEVSKSRKPRPPRGGRLFQVITLYNREFVLDYKFPVFLLVFVKINYFGAFAGFIAV